MLKPQQWLCLELSHQGKRLPGHCKPGHFPSILSFLLPYPNRETKSKVARFIKNLYRTLNLTLSCSLDYFSQLAVPQGQVAAPICLLVTFICANNKSYREGEAEHASHLPPQWARMSCSVCCPRINASSEHRWEKPNSSTQTQKRMIICISVSLHKMFGKRFISVNWQFSVSYFLLVIFWILPSE